MKQSIALVHWCVITYITKRPFLYIIFSQDRLKLSSSSAHLLRILRNEITVLLPNVPISKTKVDDLKECTKVMDSITLQFQSARWKMDGIEDAVLEMKRTEPSFNLSTAFFSSSTDLGINFLDMFVKLNLFIYEQI